MKGLGIAAIVLGIASVAFDVYAVVETRPNYVSLSNQITKTGAQTKFDIPLLEEYRSALRMEAYGAAGLGVVALILGAVAAFKGGFKPALGGALLGVVGLIWQFLWAV